MPPFSNDRATLLNKGYALIGDIMRWYEKSEARGASNRSVDLVCGFLAEYNHDILLYEAGTGIGFSCKHFLNYSNVSIKGCDVVLQDSVKELMQKYPDRISVEESTFYDSLQGLEDESIDVFYADNVFEHMFPDEFPEILALLTKKLKHGALLFLFIPNSINGPHDVSRNFLKIGQKAQGFHFMEQTYHEVTKMYKQYGIYPAYFVYKNLFKKYRYIRDSSGLLHKFKLLIEDLARIIPGRWLRNKVMGLAELSTYIMIKK